MSLFKFGKSKKEETKSCCCCEKKCNTEKIANLENTNTDICNIKVLGSGCKKCNELELETKEAIKELGIKANIDHVTDFAQIASYGVMSTPALIIDGKVASYGKVLKKDEVINLINKIRG